MLISTAFHFAISPARLALDYFIISIIFIIAIAIIFAAARRQPCPMPMFRWRFLRHFIAFISLLWLRIAIIDFRW